MVVVLVITILVALAVPTFLAARQRAQNRSAQVSLRTALQIQVAYFTDNQVFTDDPALLRASEQGLEWMGPGPSANHRSVSTVAPPPGADYFCLAVLSQSGNSFGLVYSGASGIWFGNSTGPDAAAFCAVPPAGAGIWNRDPKLGWSN